MFYYKYIENAVFLLATRGLLTPITLTISASNFTVITTDRFVFEKAYNSTSKSLVALQNMNCLVQDFTTTRYTDFFYDDSMAWLSYILVGLAVVGKFLSLYFLGLILLLKAIQIYNFDEINALYRKY